MEAPVRETKKHSNGTWCLVENGRWFPFAQSEEDIQFAAGAYALGLWERGYIAWVSGTSVEICESMSKSSIVPQSDNAEEAKEALAAKGTYPNHEVVVASSDEIMLDYDTKNVPEVFLNVLQVMQTQRFRNGKTTYSLFQSKGGNCHVVVKLPEPIADVERIAWQAAFGSDPIREALSLVSVSRNVKSPVLLYMAKDRTAVPQTYEKPGRKIRNE